MNNCYIEKDLANNYSIISNQNNRVALISFGGGIYQHSVISIASYLRGKGYKVSLIQCIASNDNDDRHFAPLTIEGLERLSEHCRGVLAVGISVLTTHYLNRAKQVNDYLKETLKVPIVWGGVPVICDPKYYLKYADYICTGEGEIFMEEFLGNIKENELITKTRGMAYHTEKEEINWTTPIPLIDVNKMPIPIIDLDNHYILSKHLVSLKDDPSKLIRQTAAKGYRIFPIRGCPFKCAFCSNNKLSEVYKGQKLLRKRRSDSVIQELLKAKEVIPEMRLVWFEEDDFFSRTDEELEDLIKMYKQHIDLPVTISATIKHTNESKLNILRDYNIEIKSIKIGLQSASKRVNREVYRRPFNREEYLVKFPLLARRKILTIVDVISDNPFERISDKIESLDFYIQLSNNLNGIKSANKYLTYLDHKLMFYPGTELYNLAINQIISENYISDVLLKRTTARGVKEVDIDKIILALFKHSIKHRAFLLVMILMKKPIIFKLIDSEIIKKFLYILQLMRNSIRKKPQKEK